MTQPPVLLVEDDEDDAFLALNALRGVDVVHAEDGATALALLGERRPRLLLLDLHLPDTDGFTLLVAVRAHPVGRTLPVIVFTSVPSDAERLAADPGPHAVTTKPLSPETFAWLTAELGV